MVNQPVGDAYLGLYAEAPNVYVRRILRPRSLVAIASASGAPSSPTVTDSDAWRDRDDATYARMVVEKDPDETSAWEDDNGTPVLRHDWVQATFDPFNATGLTSATLRVRHASADNFATSSVSFPFFFGFGDLAPAQLGVNPEAMPGPIDLGSPPPASTIQSSTTLVNAEVYPDVAAEYEAFFTAGGTVKMRQSSGFFVSGDYPNVVYSDIFDVWIEAYFNRPAVTGPAPPLRQYPRNDGLAGSAKRMWPPPRSTQGSIRRLGGYL